ncbi:BON domain-containing protein [Amnibacterium sp.]|uniref:BON domain-containing protein n=1 Tax=Amnibacterium sp. TaxID=1872496 RepID=UPI003F7BE5D8
MTTTTPATPIADHQIQRAVLEELEWTPALDVADVGVAVDHGAVTLSGVVDSYRQRLAAERAALRVRGVSAVADDIRVRPDEADVLHDDELAAMVARAFRDDAEVPAEDIHIVVRDGVVVLTGTVETNAQRVVARKVVERLRGVRGLDSRIELVRRPSAADTQERIRAAIRRNAVVDANHVTVRVEGTTAILEGRVRSFAERRQAESAAWASPHVTVVDNRIVVAA